MEFSSHRLLYRDHVIAFGPTSLRNGRFRARAVITALGSEYTIGQHFIDLGEFDRAEAAAEHARQQGIAWVDAQLSAARSRPA